MWSSSCSLRSVSTLTKRRDFFKCIKCDFKRITTYNLQINRFSVVIIFLLHNIDMSTCSDKKDFSILLVLLCSLVEQYCDMCSCHAGPLLSSHYLSPGSRVCFWKQASGDHTGRGNQGKHVRQTQPTTTDDAFHLAQCNTERVGRTSRTALETANNPFWD